MGAALAQRLRGRPQLSRRDFADGERVGEAGRRIEVRSVAERRVILDRALEEFFQTRLSGGLGIMVDDVIAALYAIAVLATLQRVL